MDYHKYLDYSNQFVDPGVMMYDLPSSAKVKFGCEINRDKYGIFSTLDNSIFVMPSKTTQVSRLFKLHTDHDIR